MFKGHHRQYEVADKQQAVVSGFAVFCNDDRYLVKDLVGKNVNPKFTEGGNLEALGRVVRPFESILKGVNKLEGKPLLQHQAIAHFNSSGEKSVIPDSINIFDSLD